jgi:hypothetical protein
MNTQCYLLACAINETLQEHLEEICMAYLDDVLIYSYTDEQHERNLRAVILKLRAAGLPLDIDKRSLHELLTMLST